MKLWKQFLGISILCLCLMGCEFLAKEDTALFYYLRTPDTYLYGESDAVIFPEQRDCSGKINNLHYLLTLYLEGPLDPACVSPFPAGTGILSLEISGTSVSIELSEEFASLSGMDRTLAGACLARTCFALHNAYQVHIYTQTQNNETVSLTLTRDDLIFMDGIPGTTPTQ